MYCIYNNIIINKQTTIIITILLIINVTLNCWFHAYWTPLGYKEGGKWLKIEPKVPPVQNKCLATCKWHKRDWCTHSFWHQVQYFTPTVTSLLYRVRYKTGLDFFENGTQKSARVHILQKWFCVLETVCNTSESLLPLQFCVVCRILYTSLSQFCFLNAALGRAAPSQGLVTFFLQVTEMLKGDKNVRRIDR